MYLVAMVQSAKTTFTKCIKGSVRIGLSSYNIVIAINSVNLLLNLSEEWEVIASYNFHY